MNYLFDRLKNFYLYKIGISDKCKYKLIKLDLEKRHKLIKVGNNISEQKLILEEYLVAEIKELEKEGIIRGFDKELLNKMGNVYVGKVSLSQHFADWSTRGQCYDMSEALSVVLGNDSIVAKGILNCPLINFEHQWVEFNHEVYDTTYHKIYPLELYYKLYNVCVISKKEGKDIDNKKFEYGYLPDIFDINKKR